jgi:hypothetical protein
MSADAFEVSVRRFVRHIAIFRTAIFRTAIFRAASIGTGLGNAAGAGFAER